MHARRLRTLTVTAALAIVAVSAAGCSSGFACTWLSGTASASCAAPMIAVEPTVVAPGDTVRVTGGLFLECHDNPNGCEPPPRTTPLGTQEITWRQGTSERALSEAEPDDAGEIGVDLVVPDDAVPGVAQIGVGFAQVELEVR